ncbi:MAG: indole-3-glycerol phosphate synthase TrpC [Bacteroidales bacterium]|nr:indole-3-glycerol phosphate synthase TrpC [Bacteroidales bacterium]
MKDILEEIVANKRVELAIAANEMPLDVLKSLTQQKIRQDGALKLRSMKQSLANSKSGIIAEFKRKSPSKGWIHADVTPEQVVPVYAEGGASACSILTDDTYFGGRLEFIQRVRPMVQIPLLRKEFIIDEYQLCEARLAGADAVLLIAADLFPDLYGQLLQTAHSLGLEVLLEVHDASELVFLQSGIPDMLGVNNRSLGTFHTDVQHSFEIAGQLQRSLRSLTVSSSSELPVLVSESGISSPDKVKELREAGFRGFLIGECFMKEADPGKALKDFIQAVEN